MHKICYLNLPKVKATKRGAVGGGGGVPLAIFIIYFNVNYLNMAKFLHKILLTVHKQKN